GSQIASRDASALLVPVLQTTAAELNVSAGHAWSAVPEHVSFGSQIEPPFGLPDPLSQTVPDGATVSIGQAPLAVPGQCSSGSQIASRPESELVVPVLQIVAVVSKVSAGHA